MIDKDREIEILKAEIDTLNKQLEAAMCSYEKEANRNYIYGELAAFQAFVEKKERIAKKNNRMRYIECCEFTLALISRYIHEKKKYEVQE